MYNGGLNLYMVLLPSLKWGPTVSSLGIIQWNITRRDHPRNMGRVSGSGPVTTWTRSFRTFDEALDQLPFFQSLSLDPPLTMEELYRRKNRYSMLEENIWVASQTVMITAQNTKSTKKGQSEKKGNQTKDQKRSWEQSERKREPPQFTPLNIPYNRLLPLIQNHPNFV